MHDDKEVAVQIIPDPSLADTATQEESHFVMVKLWHPDTWLLDAPFELWISKMASLSDFAAALAAKLSIPPEHIHSAKINSPWNFHRVELPFISWVNLTSEQQATNSIAQDPFYLSTDGILFIVKDARIESRDMTLDEKLLYKCEEYEQWLMAGGAKGAGGTAGKSGGVRR
jgi:hypothetical protein